MGIGKLLKSVRTGLLGAPAGQASASDSEYKWLEKKLATDTPKAAEPPEYDPSVDLKSEGHSTPACW